VTVAKAYRLFKAILSTAVDDGLIRRNPCRIKGAGQERSPERPVLTMRQVFDLADRTASAWESAGADWGPLPSRLAIHANSQTECAVWALTMIPAAKPGMPRAIVTGVAAVIRWGSGSCGYPAE
jgi:hypothetical protein